MLFIQMITGKMADEEERQENRQARIFRRNSKRLRRNLLDTFLLAMKEDLAEWLSGYVTTELNAINFMTKLDNGVLLCEHANIVQKHAESYALREDRDKSIEIPPKGIAFRKSGAFKGSFIARDNVSNFVSWCRDLGIPDVVLFETEDLVLHRNEKTVILTLLELARKAAKFGVIPSKLVELEEEIDREIREEEEERKRLLAGGGKRRGKLTKKPSVTKESELDKRLFLLRETLSEEKCCDVVVNEILTACTCPEKFPFVKVGEGKYRLGKSNQIIFVRILRNHVMVRVGGGWDTLEHFIQKHDPCRTRLGGFVNSRGGANTMPTAKLSAIMDIGSNQEGSTGGSSTGGSSTGGSSDGGSVDGGSVDGGSVDGGSVDGRSVNEVRVDEGRVDGGRVDGGRVDGGRVDGGHVDGGRVNGGGVDGGSDSSSESFGSCEGAPLSSLSPDSDHSSMYWSADHSSSKKSSQLLDSDSEPDAVRPARSEPSMLVVETKDATEISISQSKSDSFTEFGPDTGGSTSLKSESFTKFGPRKLSLLSTNLKESDIYLNKNPSDNWLRKHLDNQKAPRQQTAKGAGIKEKKPEAPEKMTIESIKKKYGKTVKSEKEPKNEVSPSPAEHRRTSTNPVPKKLSTDSGKRLDMGTKKNPQYRSWDQSMSTPAKRKEKPPGTKERPGATSSKKPAGKDVKLGKPKVSSTQQGRPSLIKAHTADNDTMKAKGIRRRGEDTSPRQSSAKLDMSSESKSKLPLPLSGKTSKKSLGTATGSRETLSRTPSHTRKPATKSSFKELNSTSKKN